MIATGRVLNYSGVAALTPAEIAAAAHKARCAAHVYLHAT